MGREAGLIRPARPEDAPQIARVHVDSWRTTYAGIVPNAFLENLSYERREVWWRHQLSEDRSSIFFVAESPAGEVVGFASGGPKLGEKYPDFEGELYAAYLLAEHQRRGYGSRLLGMVAEKLQEAGYGSMLAWVLRENPSRPFYDAVGGRVLGSQEIEIGGVKLEEVAYGWDDLQSLIAILR